MALAAVIEVTYHILDPNIMNSSHDHIVGIGIFYLAINSQMLNRYRAVKQMIVIQQPNLMFNKYAVSTYILLTSKHKATNSVCPILFNLYTE